MFVFNEQSTRRAPTSWGIEVKKRLIERNIRQADIIEQLKGLGYKVDKFSFNNLLYGIGVSVRADEIAEINQMLDIPYEA